jgi:hypothetical protein
MTKSQVKDVIAIFSKSVDLYDFEDFAHIRAHIVEQYDIQVSKIVALDAHLEKIQIPYSAPVYPFADVCITTEEIRFRHEWAEVLLMQLDVIDERIAAHSVKH